MYGRDFFRALYCSIFALNCLVTAASRAPGAECDNGKEPALLQPKSIGQRAPDSSTVGGHGSETQALMMSGEDASKSLADSFAHMCAMCEEMSLEETGQEARPECQRDRPVTLLQGLPSELHRAIGVYLSIADFLSEFESAKRELANPWPSLEEALVVLGQNPDGKVDGLMCIFVRGLVAKAGVEAIGPGMKSIYQIPKLQRLGSLGFLIAGMREGPSIMGAYCRALFVEKELDDQFWGEYIATIVQGIEEGIVTEEAGVRVLDLIMVDAERMGIEKIIGMIRAGFDGIQTSQSVARLRRRAMGESLCEKRMGNDTSAFRLHKEECGYQDKDHAGAYDNYQWALYRGHTDIVGSLQAQRGQELLQLLEGVNVAANNHGAVQSSAGIKYSKMVKFLGCRSHAVIEFASIWAHVYRSDKVVTHSWVEEEDLGLFRDAEPDMDDIYTLRWMSRVEFRETLDSAFKN